MYISQTQVENSLKQLESIHPFFGVSFLVFKKSELPVGKYEMLAINHKEDEFLKRYFCPDPYSNWILSTISYFRQE